MSNVLRQISDAVINGQMDDISTLTHTALISRLTAKDILKKGLMPGMEVIGVEFRRGDRFIPEVLVAASTMHIALDILKSFLTRSGEKMAGKVVIGTVKRDIRYRQETRRYDAGRLWL